MSSRFQRGVRRPVAIGALALATAVGAVRAQDGLPQATDDPTVEVTGGPGRAASNSRKSPGVVVSKKTVSRPPRDGAPAGPARGERLAQSPRRPSDDISAAPTGLPNDAGQVWKTYNIRPYTLRVTSTNRPEQAIVDWVLRETGYETWHSETVAVLNANQNTLFAYHTPQVQAVVADIVDRFVNTEAETNSFGLRVVTVGSPNWRARFQSILHAVPTQTQGIQAWLLHKEDVALLLGELHKRSDFREHSSPHLLVNNGQSTTVSAIRPRPYIRDVVVRPDLFPSYQPQQTQFDEGFSLELNPLLSLDGQFVDAVIKCNIDQLERLVKVSVPIPTGTSQRQQAEVQVPQISHFGLHERFRWPADQVLLVDLGVVATPVPGKANGLFDVLPGVGGPPRADLLVFIDSRGKIGQTPDAARTGMRDVKTYHSRY
ncbi:MAG TPA: hypothetical protein VG826_00770 [Pirellulales bacterium]|nr:hypothetical protein [Pirellulales bacterium]